MDLSLFNNSKKKLGGFMFRRIIAILIFMAGLVVLVYPYAFREINEVRYRKESTEYNEYISNLDRKKLETIVREANKYNRDIFINNDKAADPFGKTSVSANIINNRIPLIKTNTETVTEKKSPLEFMDSEEAFAYIAIPKIDEVIPIFLNATEEHLEMGAAHISGTSLPVGGENTHSVISGHRGWAEATIFRHLDKLERGDKFYIYVYGNRLAYEVIGRELINPDNISKLGIIPGEDRVTLLTCHPFPYMTYRLLVYGARTKDDGAEIMSSFKHDIVSRFTDSNINSEIEYKKDLNQEIVNEIWEENRTIFLDDEEKVKVEEKFEEIPQEKTVFNLTDKYDINTIKKINLGIAIIGIIAFIICLIKLIYELIDLFKYLYNKYNEKKAKANS